MFYATINIYNKLIIIYLRIYMKVINIGIFDSGIGGMSILKELIRVVPSHINIFYIADQAYAPYGNKNDQIIIERALLLTHELIKLKSDLIIVACNTATATAIKVLRQTYKIPFVGVEPYLNYQNKGEQNKKMVVLTTNSTLNSKKFKDLKNSLDPYNNIDIYPSSNLAQIVEEFYKKGKTEELIKLVNDELSPLKGREYTHAILGCTHYPLIGDLIENILNVKCISPCPYIVSRAQHLLNLNYNIKDTSDTANIINTINFKSTLTNNWTILNWKTLMNKF